MEIKKGTPYNILINKLHISILKSIRNGYTNKYLAKICSKLNLTYSTGTRITQEFIMVGLIEFKYDGKRKILSLTPMGKKVLYHFEKIGDTCPALKVKMDDRKRNDELKLIREERRNG